MKVRRRGRARAGPWGLLPRCGLIPQSEGGTSGPEPRLGHPRARGTIEAWFRGDRPGHRCRRDTCHQEKTHGRSIL